MTGFPCMHVIEHFKCDDELRLRVLYERAVRQGHEGIVVKKYDHMYQFKRSSDWMRMVPVKTADVVVVDITPGTKGSKYDGVVGALVVEYNNLVQKVGSGLSDAERTVYMDYPSDIIGKVIEVEYKGETDYGKMRQPRFKRVRYDKNI